MVMTPPRKPTYEKPRYNAFSPYREAHGRNGAVPSKIPIFGREEQISLGSTQRKETRYKLANNIDVYMDQGKGLLEISNGDWRLQVYQIGNDHIDATLYIGRIACPLNSTDSRIADVKNTLEEICELGIPAGIPENWITYALDLLAPGHE
jgi:hypothetical protein